MNEQTNAIECGGYRPGHPWYYVLGGRVLPPRAILESVQTGEYRGYMASDFDRADRLPEPKRSQSLRAIREAVRHSYRSNLSRYRELACKLHQARAKNGACRRTAMH